MEYVLALYDCASDLCRDGSDSLSYTENFVDPLFTIGLHDETELTLIQLKEQLLELLDVFIACGGNPNIVTSKSNSTLYHVVLANSDPDMELVMKLCEAGGDLNHANVHGTTPLMDLIMYADGDLAMDILNSIWRTKQDMSSLEAQNCSNETALWRAMLAGSPRVATELLHQGASLTPRAIISIAEWHKVSKIGGLPYTQEITVNGISAVLAPLLQDSSSYVRHTAAYVSSKFRIDQAPYSFNVDLLDKVFSNAISPVVDSTAVYKCFPEPVLDEVKKILNEETQFPFDSFSSPGIKPQDAVIFMFGKLSAGLQQLCVRQIIGHIFFTQDPRKSLELVAKLQGKMLVARKEKEKPENWDENEDEDGTEGVESSDNIVVEDMDNVTQWDVLIEFNKMTIHKLVKEVLNLPPSLLSRFEIEAARLQLGACLYNFKSIDCIQGCDGQSDEGSSSDFVDNVYLDDDSYEDDESDMFAEFMSSDEDVNDVFSDTELETDPDGSLEDEYYKNEDDSLNNDEDEYDNNEDDNIDVMYINDDLKNTSPVEMDVESTADEDSWHTEY
ncbi:hypothetical protein B7P43_G08442 [Cryptotermes secundus]|nr:hypothetical protein B7P43_G08442 [Cryptotermes secundus]